MSILTRRAAVAAAGITAAGALLPAPAVASEAGLAPAAALLARTLALLALLEPEQRKAASFAWNGAEWRNWSYFGFPTLIKPGLRLEQMTAAQKAAAWEMLASVLAPEGIAKARNVMLLQSVLAEEGSRAGDRSAERFSIAVFGVPAATGNWGVRLEGHHLHHSISVRDGHIVSVTPASFSAYPNRVARGRHAGLVTLAGEEQLARRLYRDLPPALAAKARQSEAPATNILSAAGRERANAGKTGVAISALAAGQRDLLWQLIETYAVAHLVGPLAEAQRRQVRTGDAAAVHFAWSGPNAAERAFGYRIIGDSFVIELGSVDAAAQHLHTIYHDLGNVLGRSA